MSELLEDIGPRPERRASAFEQRLREWLANAERRFDVQAKADGEIEIAMLDIIGEDWWTGGGITAKSVKARLDANPNVKTIKVLLNSPGGDAFEGLAIRSLLKRSGARVVVEIVGLAASAASVIAMAGDEIVMHEGSLIMVHEAWTISMGRAEDMRSTAEFLDKVNSGMIDIFTSRTGRTRDDVSAIVAAETWMTAPEAVEAKFADSVIAAEPKKQSKAKAMAEQATFTVKLDASELLDLTEEDLKDLADIRARRASEREESRRKQPFARSAGATPPPWGGMQPLKRR
jgi:ATP-dependent Clp protease, protease subunit